MDIRVESSFEHLTFANQDVVATPAGMDPMMIVPGGSTTCFGSSSTTCCCGMIEIGETDLGV